MCTNFGIEILWATMFFVLLVSILNFVLNFFFVSIFVLELTVIFTKYNNNFIYLLNFTVIIFSTLVRFYFYLVKLKIASNQISSFCLIHYQLNFTNDANILGKDFFFLNTLAFVFSCKFLMWESPMCKRSSK